MEQSSCSQLIAAAKLGGERLTGGGSQTSIIQHRGNLCLGMLAQELVDFFNDSRAGLARQLGAAAEGS